MLENAEKMMGKLMVYSLSRERAVDVGPGVREGPEAGDQHGPGHLLLRARLLELPRRPHAPMVLTTPQPRKEDPPWCSWAAQELDENTNT